MRGLQFFSLLVVAAIASSATAADLQPGSVTRLTFRDVDGNDLSTAGGHVTILTVVTRQSEDKAQAVADRVPDRYIGDPKFRYVTLVNFQGKLAGPLQGLTRAIIRQRLDSEAKKLKHDYDVKKITRDPRRDLFVVADFDGSAVRQLGLSPESNDVRVFVFDEQGKLVQRWTDVPPGDSLGKALALVE